MTTKQEVAAVVGVRRITSRSLDENGRINLEAAIRLVLEEATERVQIAGAAANDDAVVLALRSALSAHVREKRFVETEAASEVVIDGLMGAMNQTTHDLSVRALAAERELQEREHKQALAQLGGVTWILPKKGEQG